MGKKQELNLGGLMMGVSNRLAGAMEETKTSTTPSETQYAEEDTTVKQEQKTQEEDKPTPEEKISEEHTEETHNEPSVVTERSLEDSIDDDINMYAGITKPVSFALPKDIKRALDNFVDDYNDARPTNKTTQAKVVAQALRNFLAIYQ